MTDEPKASASAAANPERVQNGERVAVDWPDFEGRVGYQPHGDVETVSYRPNRRCDKPAVGDLRVISGKRFEVLKVGPNAFVPGMRTLELKPL
jgi:hypothetical protein